MLPQTSTPSLKKSKDIALIVRELSAALPNNKVSEATVASYVAALSDLPTESLVLACDKLRATSKFFPAVYEIRRAVAELVTGIGQLPDAATAWGQMWNEINASGYHPDQVDSPKPRFSNPLTKKVITGLFQGPRQLVASDNEAADRARFMDAYDRMKERALQDAIIPAHITAAEQTALAQMNSLAGLLSSPARERKTQ